MSYEPTQWSAGDTVTSAKLNKMEQGIAANGGILVVHQIKNGDNPPTLDKTWQEIHDADIGYIIWRNDVGSTCILITGTDSADSVYIVTIGGGIEFISDSPNGILTFSQGHSNVPK